MKTEEKQDKKRVQVLPAPFDLFRGIIVSSGTFVFGVYSFLKFIVQLTYAVLIYVQYYNDDKHYYGEQEQSYEDSRVCV